MTENIYEAPKSNLINETSPVNNELAERGTRFIAALIDGVIGLVLAIPFFIYIGPLIGYKFGDDPDLEFTVMSSAYGFILFCMVQGYYLHKNGQTIGKKLTKIKIVSTSFTDVSLATILGKRYLPLSFVTMIPVIGQILPVIDILFIFRKDRRCLHDLIAGTCVVKI